MKAKVKIETEIDARYVDVNVAVRYDDEDIAYDFPRREGNIWTAIIDIDSGRILDWPEGQTDCRLAMKVCDEGTYTLYDSAMSVLASIDQNYVPNNLIPGSYGDYIDLEIDPSGKITNWNPSNLDEFFPEDD